MNTFIKDSDDPNPLIRALSIRTMGCLKVEKIFDYLMDPLKKCLKDDDPYVRKTSALCVGKLFDLNPSTAIDNGLLNTLQDLLSDRNPMVVANAVAALSDISESSIQKNNVIFNSSALLKLLAALNECTEWGQTCILSTLADYKPATIQEASDIVERVIPRLQHINASVVLAAVKLLMVYLNLDLNEEITSIIVKKLTPPLVTLLSAEPEIQYVVLRNINLILQKRSDILNNEIRIFFTKYNDPPYIKMEKLEIIVKLASASNIDEVLSELKEYANEVDIAFVRKSVQAIGRCAIRISTDSDKCVKLLIELLSLGVGHITQEVVVVMKDIFRKYPHKYEGFIKDMCSNLDILVEADSKTALIWIIGEYSTQIPNAIELLEHFLESFKHESSMVQLQLITTSIKLFLKKPGSMQEIVQRVLKIATEQIENPDIRDRSYIYGRLLANSSETARITVLSEKDPIESEQNLISDALLNELIPNIGNLSSVLHKSPALLSRTTYLDINAFRDPGADDEAIDAAIIIEAAKAAGGVLIENLLDLDFGDNPSPNSIHSSTLKSETVLDLMTMDIPKAVQQPIVKQEVFLDPDSTKGLSVTGVFTKRNEKVFLDMTFGNKSNSVMSEIAIQLNVNSYGFMPNEPLSLTYLNPGTTSNVSLELNRNGPPKQMNPISLLQVAIKNNIGVYYFAVHIPPSIVG